MAIYSTFFLCRPDELPGGFPSWRLPLPKPVSRKVKNPFTGKEMTIETRAPEWTDDAGVDEEPAECRVVQGNGRYEDYLENRLLAFIRARPHWCAKGILGVALNELAEIAGFKTALLDDAMYCPPSLGNSLQQVCPELLATLMCMSAEELKLFAERWAEEMSTPGHTHSISGLQISNGWSSDDALQILAPLTQLARKVATGQVMYLLIEG